MHCALPLPELLFSSPMASVSNTKAFSHADLKLSLLSRKRVVSGWGFYVQFHTKFKFGQAICALATVENEPFAPSSSLESRIGSDLNLGASLDDFQEDSDLDDREKLRRSRISRANKGNIPWNKGKKHSPETLQLIRERTKIAMQNPKVKTKLVNIGHAHSEDTRSKIAEGVKEGWRRRREKIIIQEGCHLEWRNIIAEAARIGSCGDKELHWDSYELLQEELEREWVQSVQMRRSMLRQHIKRAPMSLEQKKRIAEAVRAKWTDPEYRQRVHTAKTKEKNHVSASDSEKKQKKKPARTSSSNMNKSTESKIVKSEMKSVTVHEKTKKDAPSYKDPMASTKLEMIKKIKDQRLAKDMKKKETVERAKLLIAEAEKAAKALEVAALKNPLARDSLVVARNLIAKATKMLDSIEQGPPLANSSLNDASSSDSETSDQVPTKLHINGKCSFNLDESAPSLTLNGSAKAINGCFISVNGLVGGEDNLKVEEDEKGEERVPGKLVEMEGD
ncbi:muscle M-line assembly protein [Rhynchospora pubera]|uniref:Muscle M-line assembly protein n=1 Tax=Rhynchospora pubera TaxID=906938 RepID=A0AAV8C9Y1_9POAL|nr:muscle M-line assembly protein [Rhynchospora pubera]